MPLRHDRHLASFGAFYPSRALLRKHLAGHRQATRIGPPLSSHIQSWSFGAHHPCPNIVQTGPCDGSMLPALAGSVRRVRVSRHAAALEVLRRVTHQATIPAPPAIAEPSTSEGLILRFPTLEFRNLLLNAIGRDTFPDRGVWKRHKVALCGLLLHLDDGDLLAYDAALELLVDQIFMDNRDRRGPAGRRQGRVRGRTRTRASRQEPCGGGGGEGESPSSSSDEDPLLRWMQMKQQSQTYGAPHGTVVASRQEDFSVACSHAQNEQPCQTQQQQRQLPEQVQHERREGVSVEQAPAPGVPHSRSRSVAARRASLRTRIDAWCRATVGGHVATISGDTAGQPMMQPASMGCRRNGCSGGGDGSTAFVTLRPMLEQVLGMGEPAPLVDIRRNGSHTELQVEKWRAASSG
ncbi:hypothetical protein Vretimale_8781 [Volvox reticuliferus]|uniref:Uncharacterized protein n=1 Tax=Volvox reticuliferus TaxID=1737510 RepID=A0A8J4LPC0_9CHLO|nr:hypothetical protein Vretimale_8781 [Volvox reticuliferus]